MQADDSSNQNLKDRLKLLAGSAGGLSKFQVAVIATLLVLIALGSGVAYLRSRPREISIKESKSISAGEKKRMLTVHVAGAVARPGVYKMAEGTRVADALAMAGGATADGIIDDVNSGSARHGEHISHP